MFHHKQQGDQLLLKWIKTFLTSVHITWLFDLTLYLGCMFAQDSHASLILKVTRHDCLMTGEKSLVRHCKIHYRKGYSEIWILKYDNGMKDR